MISSLQSPLHGDVRKISLPITLSFTQAGVRSGCKPNRMAAWPVTWGQDMEVPLFTTVIDR